MSVFACGELSKGIRRLAGTTIPGDVEPLHRDSRGIDQHIEGRLSACDLQARFSKIECTSRVARVRFASARGASLCTELSENQYRALVQSGSGTALPHKMPHPVFTRPRSALPAIYPAQEPVESI